MTIQTRRKKKRKRKRSRRSRYNWLAAGGIRVNVAVAAVLLEQHLIDRCWATNQLISWDPEVGPQGGTTPERLPSEGSARHSKEKPPQEDVRRSSSSASSSS